MLVKRFKNMNRVNIAYVNDHSNLTRVLSVLSHHHSISIIHKADSKAFLHFWSVRQIILCVRMQERECVNQCVHYFITFFTLAY